MRPGPGPGRRHGDRIELRGLRVLGRHGAAPGERDQAQPFLVDLDLSVDLAAAGSSDALGDTVDYAAAAAAALSVVAGESHALLERLARRIGDEVCGLDDRIRRVDVVVRKLRPPVPADLATAGVAVSVEEVRNRLRRRAFLGLGANLGERWSTLRGAVADLDEVVGVSGVYATEPQGGPPDQPDYLNVVVELWTARSPRRLLGVAQRLEAEAGRVRGEHHGPRVLDVDVLWVDGETSEAVDVVVPHPRMFERRFVLAPLAELAPDLVSADQLAAAAGAVQRLGPLGSPSGQR